MASLRWDSNLNLDDIAKEIENIGRDANDIAKKCIDAASGALVDAFRSQISSVASSTSTHELANSIEATQARVNSYGVFSAARPVGTHSSGKRNGELLAYLEYGTSKRSPKPVRASAVAKAEGKIKNIIENEFQSEIQKRLK